MIDLFDNDLICMRSMTPKSEILQYYRFKQKYYSISKIVINIMFDNDQQKYHPGFEAAI